jgi:type I restriction enzyme M protein
MTISTTIKTLQVIMRKDVGVDGDAQRIGQLVWMLFLKIFDDKESEWELMEARYRSPIPERLRWRNWAADPEGMTGDRLLEFCNNELFPQLKELQLGGNGRSRGFVVRSVFEDAYQYMKSGTLLRQVINKLNEAIDFNDSQNRHLLGDMYEQILRDLQSAGNAGEYYTPRAVTQFMVEMVDPQLGETVLDPACGTGGFLTCAIEHIRRHCVKTPEDEQTMQASVRGVEKKPLPHLLCTTNMLLHGIDIPSNIRHDNTLARPLRDYGPKDRVDVILTNPPFGGMEEDGIESNFPKMFQTRETADLFLLLIMHVLKPGGRAAIVLPDGTLFGEGVKTRIKERLLDECNLHTVVRLPNGVFAPYTGIKTNLLFFTKGERTKHVWYYEHPYPAGVKSYNKTKPIRIEEFAAEKKWWKRRKENEQAWKVPVDQIKARVQPGHQEPARRPRCPRRSGGVAAGVSGIAGRNPADTRRAEAGTGRSVGGLTRRREDAKMMVARTHGNS